MKQHRFPVVVLALLMAFGLAACDVLDTSPTASLAEDEIFNTPSGAEAVMTGAYDALQGFIDDYVIFGDLASDNAVHSGSYPSWLEVDQHNLLASNVEASGQWIGSYDLINIANNLIAEVPGIGATGNFTEARKAQIVAEAKVLRAFAYHNLVRWFGGVPIVTEPTRGIDESSFKARASVEEVYTLIINDLKEAEAALGTANRNAALIDGYVAKALLSRVYLYRQNWSEAAAKAQEVISGPFQLASLESLFRGKGSSESIWELFYSDQDQNALAFFAQPTTAGGRYEYAPDPRLVADFAAGDLRRPYNLNAAGTVINKYIRTTTGDDPVHLIRLGEVILNRAEALARQGQDGPARDLLNQIRSRAGLAPVAGTLSGSDLVTAILEERQVELAFEGHRWHDLVRTNRAVSVLNLPSPNVTLWPIPQREINVNQNLTQNPGY